MAAELTGRASTNAAPTPSRLPWEWLDASARIEEQHQRQRREARLEPGGVSSESPPVEVERERAVDQQPLQSNHRSQPRYIPPISHSSPGASTNRYQHRNHLFEAHDSIDRAQKWFEPQDDIGKPTCERLNTNWIWANEFLAESGESDWIEHQQHDGASAADASSSAPPEIAHPSHRTLAEAVAVFSLLSAGQCGQPITLPIRLTPTGKNSRMMGVGSAPQHQQQPPSDHPLPVLWPMVLHAADVTIASLMAPLLDHGGSVGSGKEEEESPFSATPYNGARRGNNNTSGSNSDNDDVNGGSRRHQGRLRRIAGIETAASLASGVLPAAPRRRKLASPTPTANLAQARSSDDGDGTDKSRADGNSVAADQWRADVASAEQRPRADGGAAAAPAAMSSAAPTTTDTSPTTVRSSAGVSRRRAGEGGSPVVTLQAGHRNSNSTSFDDQRHTRRLEKDFQQRLVRQLRSNIISLEADALFELHDLGAPEKWRLSKSFTFRRDVLVALARILDTPHLAQRRPRRSVALALHCFAMACAVTPELWRVDDGGSMRALASSSVAAGLPSAVAADAAASSATDGSMMPQPSGFGAQSSVTAASAAAAAAASAAAGPPIDAAASENQAVGRAPWLTNSLVRRILLFIAAGPAFAIENAALSSCFHLTRLEGGAEAILRNGGLQATMRALCVPAMKMPARGLWTVLMNQMLEVDAELGGGCLLAAEQPLAPAEHAARVEAEKELETVEPPARRERLQFLVAAFGREVVPVLPILLHPDSCVDGNTVMSLLLSFGKLPLAMLRRVIRDTDLIGNLAAAALRWPVIIVQGLRLVHRALIVCTNVVRLDLTREEVEARVRSTLGLAFEPTRELLGLYCASATSTPATAARSAESSAADRVARDLRALLM